ncbi:MAG: 7-cyano-7-deazaguanine synthase, partial [Bradyrhizobium sp.]
TASSVAWGCFQYFGGAQHDWGYGCGECPACSLRAKGWREYVAQGGA